MYMIRKQLYIDEEHERLLKERSRELGVSEAELVRRALDRLLRDDEPAAASARRRRAAEQWYADRGRLRGRVQAWSREQLYEDRLGRYGR